MISSPSFRLLLFNPAPVGFAAIAVASSTGRQVALASCTSKKHKEAFTAESLLGELARGARKQLASGTCTKNLLGEFGGPSFANKPDAPAGTLGRKNTCQVWRQQRPESQRLPVHRSGAFGGDTCVIFEGPFLGRFYTDMKRNTEILLRVPIPQKGHEI